MQVARGRGRPPKNFTQFSHVGRERGSVYLAELSDGTVKVGFSDNPRTRLRTLGGEVRRNFGCTLTRFHVYAGIGHTLKTDRAYHYVGAKARAIEALCVRALAAVATPRAPSTEYFEGISFDAAKVLLDGEIAKAGA